MLTSLLTRALATGLAATGLVAAPAVAVRAKPPLAHLALPAPSGPDDVGIRTMRLVDAARHDPWVAAQPYRELMVSVLYPARDAARFILADNVRRIYGL